MRIVIRERSTGQVTQQRLCGAGWEFEVTGRPAWVKKMVKKYVPEIQRIAQSSGATKHREGK